MVLWNMPNYEKIRIINQQGNANDAILIETIGNGGITINPKNSNKLIILNIPESDSGLHKGQVYKDSNGFLKIV